MNKKKAWELTKKGWEKAKKISEYVGFTMIIIVSAVIWIPRTAWQMGIIISDNIRTFYLDKEDNQDA